MNLFKKIFSIRRKNAVLPIKERYPENAAGDFYVVNEACITCGAPQAAAPDLIDHSKLAYEHCYFKKQPATADELDSAITAMQLSCIAGIRYRGKDKVILNKLYSSGLQAACDYTIEDIT